MASQQFERLLAEIKADAAEAAHRESRAKPERRSKPRNRSKMAHIGRERFPSRAEREASSD